MQTFHTVSSLFLSVLLALNATWALQWSASPRDGQIIYACANHPVQLAWGYSLDTGDVVLSTEWTYEGLSHEMVAVSLHGNFLPTPPFAHRVQLRPDAGLTLSHVTPSDAGNYSVTVTAHNASGVSFTTQRTVQLLVSDDLMTRDHELHAVQQSVADFSKDDNQWHAVLTCGHFTYISDPPVWVEWLIPDGQTLPSTMYKDGLFHLLLPNPVVDGSYTCRISPSAINASCAHSEGLQASVEVDGILVRLSLVEAQQHNLEAENAKKEAAIGQLSGTVQTLQSQLTSQSEQLHSLQSTLSQTQDEVRNLSSCCMAHTGQGAPAIAFTARLSTDIHLSSGATIVLPHTLVNDGGAYNRGTGRFTAPVTGVYHFSVTAVPYAESNGSAAEVLLKSNSAAMGSNVFALKSYYDGHHQTASLQGVLRLQKGEQVWLIAHSDSHFAYDEYTVFTGFLLFVD